MQHATKQIFPNSFYESEVTVLQAEHNSDSVLLQSHTKNTKPEIDLKLIHSLMTTHANPIGSSVDERYQPHRCNSHVSQLPTSYLDPLSDNFLPIVANSTEPPVGKQLKNELIPNRNRLRRIDSHRFASLSNPSTQHPPVVCHW